MSYTFTDVENNMWFNGSFKKLKKLVARKGSKGKWITDGFAEEFRESSGERLRWWRDSGCVAFFYPKYELYVDDTTPPRPKVNLKPIEWSVLESGDGAGMTLPELLIQDCPSFIDRYKDDSGGLPKRMQKEAELLAERASNIRIPRRLARDGVTQVVHRFGRENFYLGFTLETETELNRRRWGKFVVDDRIDLMLPDRTLISSEPIHDAVEDFQTIFDDRVRRWDRKRCDDFFNDRGNFHAT